MLSFTTPLLLAGLLLVPAIRWLHRGGPQRPRVPVASLVLWRRAAADSAGAGERRPPDPAWRRRALLASLLVVALAGPQLPDRSGRVTVWVDDSLSMLTREARGSRIEAGLADVRSALAAAGAGEVEVRTLGDPWRRYGTLDDATAADIVAGAGREEPAPPPAALLRKDRQHWLLTDGADAAILQWQDGTMPDRSVRVAQVTRNAGLELGSARRSLEDPGSYELLFKITNGGTATEARQLVVETDAGVVGRSAWTVDAGESALVRATIAASASVRASLQPADALAADDSISLDLAALRPRRIAADPRCPPGLLAALRAHPAIVVAAPGTPGVEAAINCGAEQRAPGIATLHVRTDRVPSAPDGFLQWSSSLSDVDHIALDGESLQVAGRVDPRPGDKVLLAAGDDALIVERAGAPAVIETSLDFAAADATGGSATPLLADLLLAQLLGTRPLDDVVLLDRGRRATMVAPTEEPDAVAPTSAPQEMHAHDATAPLVMGALLVLLWEIVALIRRWYRQREPARTLPTLALQVLAVAALAAALLGVSWLDARTKPRVLLLVDRSQSVPRVLGDAAVAEVLQAAEESRSGEVRVIEFGGRPLDPSTAGDTWPAATDIERALEAALAAHAERRYSVAVLVSDGHETAGDALRGLRATREAGLPVRWFGVGRPLPATRIVDVLAPDVVQAGLPVQVTVRLAGRLDSPLRVNATTRTSAGDLQSATARPDDSGRATLLLPGNAGGELLVGITLQDASSGETLDAWDDAAAVEVTARATILYVQGAAGPLARSLAEGGWNVDVVPASRVDAFADRVADHGVIVLDDVAVDDAGPHFWDELTSAVRDQGIGLLALGGERSFSAGGYRESQLESVLPVQSEPAALDQPASVVFAVDKSGSMGAGAAGVDRFRLAQRAVIEAARGLTGRDSLGVVVFDVEPRVLMPLGPADAGKVLLERDWRTTPRGGTRLAPALEAAAAELERSAASRRILVVVTDGFIDQSSLETVRERMRMSRIETLAFAVGPDANLAALSRLVEPGSGRAVRVGEAAVLPRVVRAELERRRARTERGRIEVVQERPLPIAQGVFRDWPPVAAYAVTRSRPEAAIAVRSRRGDPLVALASPGQGRVVAITSGLGRWTPDWLGWSEWPRLAGGLVGWVSGAPGAGTLGLTVTDLARGLRIEADLRDAAGWADTIGASLRVTTPSGRTRSVALEHLAPGRARVDLPDEGPGLYALVVSTPLGTQRVLHLRRSLAEAAARGTSPAVDSWRKSGLILDWDPSAVASARSSLPDVAAIDRWIVALALGLFLAGVVADRRGPPVTRSTLRGWSRSLPALVRGSFRRRG